MEVTANGKTFVLDSGATIGQLLDTMGMTGRVVAVELNGEAIVRGEHATTALRDGDKVEVVRAVAGG